MPAHVLRSFLLRPLLASVLALGWVTPALAQPAKPQPPATTPAPAPVEDTTADDAGADTTPGEPAAAPSAEPAPDTSGVDVDALRQEYLRLRDQLFRSRARAAAVASALYSTRVTIYLDYTTARFYSIGRATIRLDGANVYENTSGAIGADKAPRFEGYIAPGRHQITFRVEATGKDDERFTSAVENSVVVQAPPGKDLVISAVAKDDGNIAFEWKKSETGSYKLGLDVKVKAVKRSQKDEGRIRRASN